MSGTLLKTTYSSYLFLFTKKPPKRNTFVAFFAAVGVILAAGYMLLLFKKIFLGEINTNILKVKKDLTVNEITVFVILVVLIIYIGIQPNYLLDFSTASIERIITLYPISIF